MLPSYSLYPRIADDILLVIDSEKAQMKIARIKHGSSHNAQKKNAAVELPWAGHDRDVRRGGFSFGRFLLPFLCGRMPRRRGGMWRRLGFVFFD